MTIATAKTTSAFTPATFNTISSDQFISPKYCILSDYQRSDLLEVMKIYVEDHNKWMKIFKGNRKVKLLDDFQTSYADWVEEMTLAICDYMPCEEDEGRDNYKTLIVEGHPYYLFKMTNKNLSPDNFVKYYLRNHGFEPSIGSYMEWVNAQLSQQGTPGVKFVQNSYSRWKVQSFQDRIKMYEDEILKEKGYLDRSGTLAAYRRASYGDSAMGYINLEIPTTPEQETEYMENSAKVDEWAQSEIKRLFPPLEQEEVKEEEDEQSLIKKAISSAMMAFSAANRNAGKAHAKGSTLEEIKDLFSVWWDTNFIKKIVDVVGDKINQMASMISGKFLRPPQDEAEANSLLSSPKPKFPKKLITGLEEIKENLFTLWMFKVDTGLACGSTGSSINKYGRNYGSVASARFGKAGTKEPCSNTKNVPAISGGGKGFDCYIGE
jgi:hypothetical protein